MVDLIHHENRVLACVDHSHFAEFVTDYAAWCANRLALPLELLHILERHPERASRSDHSGTIGVESQHVLLEELVSAEAQQNKFAREQGRVFLAALRMRAMAVGIANPSMRQRYGDLEATLVEQETSVDMFVLGRRGQSAESTGRELGRNLERVVRALHRPILAVSEAFLPPQRILVAFDGSATTRRGIEMIAASPLFRGLACDVLMAGDAGRTGAAGLEWASERLIGAGLEATMIARSGNPEQEIAETIVARKIDLLVMGAYGHSILRRLFRRSRTSDLLRASAIPTLLLR